MHDDILPSAQPELERVADLPASRSEGMSGMEPVHQRSREATDPQLDVSGGREVLAVELGSVDTL